MSYLILFILGYFGGHELNSSNPQLMNKHRFSKVPIIPVEEYRPIWISTKKQAKDKNEPLEK